MPEPMIRDDLLAGRLVNLDRPDSIERYYVMEAIYRRARRQGRSADG